jgi:hypothetical protein
MWRRAWRNSRDSGPILSSQGGTPRLNSTQRVGLTDPRFFYTSPQEGLIWRKCLLVLYSTYDCACGYYSSSHDGSDADSNTG